MPDQFSRGKKLKKFWPGHKHERSQVIDVLPSFAFAFTGSGILKEIEEQRTASSAFQPVGVLRRTEGQIISRVRPLLTRINTSDIPPAIPEAESVPRISSAASYSSIDIPEVEDVPQLLSESRQRSPKVDNDPFVNPFPSLANLYLDENIRPLPSPVLYEAVYPPPLSQVSSRLPSSEATSVYSSDRYFSSTDSLGDFTPSSSTTPLAGLRTLGRASGKGKKEWHGGEGRLLGWVRGVWRRGLGALMS